MKCRKDHAFKLEKNLTRANVVALCLDLNEEFKTEGFTFEPEPITDGFIYFTNYEGPLYKSMRMRSSGNIEWPWVPADVMSVWKEDNTVIYSAPTYAQRGMGCPLKKIYHAKLKVSSGATAWTTRELQRFKSVFAEYGIVPCRRH